MVKTLALDATHDLAIDAAGNLTVLDGRAAVAAACQTACLTQMGECVLQAGLGLPNFSLIWVGSPDYALWQSYLETVLLGVDGVSGVADVTLAARDNVLSYRAQVATIYDPQPILVQGNISD